MIQKNYFSIIIKNVLSKKTILWSLCSVDFLYYYNKLQTKKIASFKQMLANKFNNQIIVYSLLIKKQVSAKSYI